MSENNKALEPDFVAHVVLNTYKSMVGMFNYGTQTTVSGLLADLMHYCEKNSLSFETALVDAQKYFEEEADEDDSGLEHCEEKCDVCEYPFSEEQ